MSGPAFHRGAERTAGSAKGKIMLTIFVGALLYALFNYLSDRDIVSLPDDILKTVEPAKKETKTEPGTDTAPGNGKKPAKPAAADESARDARETKTESAPKNVGTVQNQLNEAGAVGSDGKPRNPGGGDTRSDRTRSPSNSPASGKDADAEVDPVVVLENRMLALEAEVRNVKNVLVRVDQALGNRIDALNEKQAELDRNLDRMNSALETMERRVFEHRTTIARLERDIRQPGGRVDMRNPVVLAPKKLYRNAPLKLFDGQVLLHLTGFRKDSGAEPGDPPVFLGADFEITLPILDILVLNGVAVGERRVFRYADRDFFLELLGTDEETWARVAITRKLPD